MTAMSLLVVFALARTAILLGHTVPASSWSPVAYLWQDVAVVLLFALFEWCLGPRRRIVWTVYAVLASYAAITVPVARVLATPLTWPMLRAARGPLADSIRHDATWQNALIAVSVFAASIVAPRVVRRSPPLLVWVALALCVALGPTASGRVDTLGLERNAWTALAATAIPRTSADSSSRPWQSAGFDRQPHEDLSRFRGAAAGRNVLLVSLESTAAEYLRLYGAAEDVMPNFSELARSALVFDRAYAVYPESIKGLFSILCSDYPAFDVAAEAYADVPCRSIPAVLSANGYRSALFHSGRFDYLGMQAVVRNRGYARLADAGDIGGNHNSSFGVDEPSTVANILNWIDALPPRQRFFVTYLPIAGHHPYETPERGPFPDADEFGRYRNALYYGDASLGALMRGLRARHLDRDTLWIVVGDHGEAFGQHEGNYGHTFRLYDENVHVPFVVAAPGLIPGQIRSARVVSLLDTAPTVLDLIGLGAQETHRTGQYFQGYQGRSVLDSEPRMAFFFADYSVRMFGVRDGSRKFIYELDSGRARLFDLDADPRERVDLSERFAAETHWYTSNLQSWSAAQKERVSRASAH